MNGAKTFLKDAVLLRVTFAKLGGKRKADKSKIETKADKNRVSLSKTLFDCPEYSAVRNFDKDLARWVKSRAIAANVGYKGVYVLPLALLQPVEEMLENKMAERMKLVEKFMAVYITERDRAVDRLADLYREDDYPPVDVALARFVMSWSYVAFGVPQELPPEILDREKQKLETRFEMMAEEVKEALRAGMSELMGHLVERLTPKEDGSKKVFRDTAIDNLVEFLDLFGARNVAQDDELARICASARQVVKSASPEAMREVAAVRDKVRTKMNDLKTAVDGLMENARKRRRFNFEDDSE